MADAALGVEEDERGTSSTTPAGDLDLAGEATDREWSIRCTDVVKRLAGIPVLNGLNVAIPDDMITVVLGPSGTGKSVLIKHLIGLMFPDSGNIQVLGNSVPKLTMPKLLELRRRIGVLFQDGALFGSMSVFDNVAFPLRQHTDMSEGQIGERVRQRLADVGLAEAMDDAPSQLSGGMRKRAGFARALVTEPDIVIFDEPDSGLDPVRTALLCELIQEMHEPTAAPISSLRTTSPRRARSASTSRCCGAGGSSKRAMPSGCSPRRTPSCASSSAGRPAARWAWTEPTVCGEAPSHMRTYVRIWSCAYTYLASP